MALGAAISKRRSFCPTQVYRESAVNKALRVLLTQKSMQEEDEAAYKAGTKVGLPQGSDQLFAGVGALSVSRRTDDAKLAGPF